MTSAVASENRDHAWQILGHHRYLLVQKQRQQSRLWQLLGHLTVVYWGKDPGLSHPQLPDQPHLWRQSAKRLSAALDLVTALSVWSSLSRRNTSNRRWTSMQSSLTLPRPQHSQLEGSVDHPHQAWLPKEIYQYHLPFHDGITGLVLVSASGISFAPFDISNGMKQGCILTIYCSTFFSWILTHALQDLNCCIYLKYSWMDPHLTCIDWMPRPKPMNTPSLKHSFADDCALMAHMESDLQFMSEFAEAAQLFGVTISMSKTEVLHQPAPGSAAPSPNMQSDSTSWKW